MVLGYMLIPSFGLLGASKSRQNVGRPCHFPLILKGPDSCAGLEKACRSVHEAPPAHLLSTDLASPSLMGSPGPAPGEQQGEGNQGPLASQERPRFC